MPTLRQTLRVGEAVTLLRPLSTYDYRMTLPAGTTGLVGAVRVPCVRYGSGFPHDEFVCVDVTLAEHDFTPEQREQAEENAPYRRGEVPDTYFAGIFGHGRVPIIGGVSRAIFRVAAPYDGLKRAAFLPGASVLEQAVIQETLPVHANAYWSHPFPWLNGLTREEALAHMAALSEQERLSLQVPIQPALLSMSAA